MLWPTLLGWVNSMLNPELRAVKKKLFVELSNKSLGSKVLFKEGIGIKPHDLTDQSSGTVVRVPYCLWKITRSRGRTKSTFGAVHVLLEVTTSVSTGCISSVRSMTQSAASVPPVASSPPSGLSARQ